MKAKAEALPRRAPRQTLNIRIPADERLRHSMQTMPPWAKA
jgi:hypothetical protein